MERAVVHRAVAEERHGHAVGLEQLEAVAGARRLQNARADDAAGAHHADLGGEQVHAAAAAARTAGRSAVQLGDQLLGGATPLARAWPWPRWVLNTVVVAQVGTNAGGDRLLADVGVAGAGDYAA